MADNCTCNSCYNAVEGKIGAVFAAYGRFLARHPWKIIIIGILLNGLLGLGMLRINVVTDVKTVYTPMNSQASKDSDKLKDIFPDTSGTNFIGIQIPDVRQQGEVIVRPKQGNILDIDFLNELKLLYNALLSIEATDKNGKTVPLSNVCAKSFTNCAIDGDIFVDMEFQKAVTAGLVTYPYFIHSIRGPVYYEQIVGGANVSAPYLQSATMLILRVNLRTDSDSDQTAVKNWQSAFEDKMQDYNSTRFDIAYSHSESLKEELDNNVSGDITYFSITFTLMITYACVATMTARCDCVGQRYNLGFGGVVAAGLAIVSGFGTVSLCGIDFVSIVGVVPFLILGIGVDGMFLLMSGVTETNYDDSIETRIGETMRTSGVSITITSLTDLLAFAAGASSVFLGVRNFCIYSGAAVVFCFINQASIFMACIAINERRYEQNRHYVTCLPVKTKQQCEDEGRSECYIKCCSGRKPKNQRESESFLDRLPRWLVPKIVLKWPFKIIILLMFAAYLAVSVYGITKLGQGLELKNLVSKDSYYYQFRDWFDGNFPEGISVSFVFDSEMEYSATPTQTKIKELISNVKNESTIQDNFEINWLASFKNDALYENSSETSFITNLKLFLSKRSNSRFENDVVIDSARNVIKASRIHLISESIKGTQEKGNFMLRMRELASKSSLSVFAFSPGFIYYEQYVAILSQTLQTFGIAIGMVFLVTCIFMPHPLLLLYVTVTVAMITAGIFGFLPFLDLTLSSITMIHIIMSIGFSVDFAAHICHGYMISTGSTRNEQMRAGIIRSGAPVFHGAISSLLGVLILAFARSYIFHSFFKVMSLVVIFGILHALLLLPVVLSLIGPKPTAKEAPETDNRIDHELQKML